MHYGRLDEAVLRGGGSVTDLIDRWRAFLQPEDVICHWGNYAVDLFRAEGGCVPERVVDVRKVTGDYLQRRPGSPESLIETLGLQWQPSGQGRGGERLGMLVAVTGWLAGAARG